ncbi:hypothetical protein pb186bvf_011648 [Paramecium bursaria]
MNQDAFTMDQAMYQKNQQSRDYIEVGECLIFLCYLTFKIAKDKEKFFSLTPFSTINMVVVLGILTRAIQEIITIIQYNTDPDEKEKISSLDTWGAFLAYVGFFFRISLFSLFFYLISKLGHQNEQNQFDKSSKVLFRKLFYLNKFFFIIVITVNFSAYFQEQNTQNINRNLYNLLKTFFCLIWSVGNLFIFYLNQENVKSSKEKYYIYWIFYLIITSFITYSTLPMRGLIFQKELSNLKCLNEEIWCGHKDFSYSIYFFVYIQICSYIPILSIFMYFDYPYYLGQIIRLSKVYCNICYKPYVF